MNATNWITRKIAELEFVLEQPTLTDTDRHRSERMLRELKLQLADLRTNSDGVIDD